MSPLLFNLAMDPLIQALKVLGEGYGWDGWTIVMLAFADDLVLLSGLDMGMRRSLMVLEDFCEVTGLSVQPRKCHRFMIEKGMVLTDRTWMIRVETIHQLKPGETVRYPGLEIEPWKGIVVQDPSSKLQEWVGWIKRAPFKPSQCVAVLNSFALLRLIYQADLGNMPMTTLAKLDGIVRKAVKGWLHLLLSTCDGLIYCW